MAADPDSRTEAELKRQIVVLQEENVALKKELTISDSKLKQQVAVAQAVPQELSKKVQSLVQAHADDRHALEQTQAQTSQTLVNTDASMQAQIEFQKQLIRLVKTSTVTNGNITKLLFMNLAMMVLVLCFLGLLLYPSLWRQNSQPKGAVEHGGI